MNDNKNVTGQRPGNRPFENGVNGKAWATTADPPEVQPDRPGANALDGAFRTHWQQLWEQPCDDGEKLDQIS